MLLSFKGEKEAAAFIATSETGVEEVRAVIVGGEKIDAERLRAHCRPHMPHVFVPEHVVTLNALPVNAMGKVDRSSLKNRFTGTAP